MGVKSLWTLLTPVGRPVMLETVEGKTMAIDSSIWLYQFQATMRDKEGRALVNAHVLGFLRRISKLLFYGIKPVFVFDGGAPALKRNTLNERKKKKSGAASSHIKLAEKLLAAQMRREALNHGGNNQTKSESSKGKNRETQGILLNEDTVYLEDVDGSAPKTPLKRKPPTPPSSSKKNKFQNYDPYNLPHVDLEEAITKATRSAAPDPRLATEDELQAFIDQMRPEDFDVNSPAFRELPTEVQYEIIGDLRLKSRQTSYARLHKMLSTARTPLDFSKQQIQNLRQRNALTQQLLMTTDSIGSAHIAIPVRIASERNKEYILIKNDGESGGWILGIKDTGTRDKPIVIDHEEDAPSKDEEDSDAYMEEVGVPTLAVPDPDLREYQREMALTGISKRNTSKGLPPLTARPINRKTKSATLFAFEDDIPDELSRALRPDEHQDDELLAYAIQASLDQSKASKVQPSPFAPEESSTPPKRREVSPEDDFYADFTTPNRLDTALAIANAGPSRRHSTPSKANKVSLFGAQSLLSSSPKIISMQQASSDSDESMEEDVLPNLAETDVSQFERNLSLELGGDSPPSFTLSGNLLKPSENINQKKETPRAREDMQKVPIEIRAIEPPSFTLSGNFLRPLEDVDLESEAPQAETESDDDMEEVPVEIQVTDPPPATKAVTIELPSRGHPASPKLSFHFPEIKSIVPQADLSSSNPQTFPSIPHTQLDETTAETLFAWSRTPSPAREIESIPSSPLMPEEWDAAEEIDVHAEEGEFARFMSQVKGKNMDDVRREIDEEIKSLDQQRKIAMRDSEDITQQMITQIMTMLRLFGIPYITSPMEAEAQCAELVSLNLVDGVITDDSDVFLFGAQRVYKNMFNQSKTVECFLLSDLSRELGLDRDTLIQLAYLLGSDYTEGLPGVGPVVAMELLKEFSGHSGLYKFKDWWMKVQSGKDQAEDNQSKFRKQFKKKFKNLYLADDWPNSVVRDAYYHPTVDSSEEPFKWGMPDLDGLRAFFHQELGWQESKVDELLLPIIQKMNKRNQVAALNKQGNLNEFLDISAGNGTHAPRQRQAYQSKRLQQVISDFRNRHKSGSATPSSRSGSTPSQDGLRDSDSGSGSHEDRPPAKKQKRKASAASSRKEPKGKATTGPSKLRRGAEGAGSSNSGGRGGRKGTRGKKARDLGPRSDEDFAISDEDSGGDAFVPIAPSDFVVEREVNLRPRPKPRPIGRGARTGDVTQTEVVGTGEPPQSTGSPSIDP